MKKLRMQLSLALVLTPSGLAQSGVPTASITRWPQDRTAAISLSFDDGIDTHLDIVGPILRKHHLQATFFVATGLGPFEKRKSEWKQLAEQGNELGNHTVHHPCLLPEITPHSQDYTPAMMEGEIRDAAQEISQLLDRQRGLTFAYPCGNMSFGKPQDEVKNAALYLQYVSQYAFAARAVGSGAQNPDELNVLAVNDLGVTADKDFPALLDMAQPAIKGHIWGIYCFHGVGGDWLSITPQALDELTAYLERHAEVWTATFGDVVRYIQERRAASIRVTQSDPTSIEVAMTGSLDKRIYDVPLTLKIEVPAQWKEAAASANGKPVAAKIVEGTKGTTILVDVPAQTTDLRIAAR